MNFEYAKTTTVEALAEQVLRQEQLIEQLWTL